MSYERASFSRGSFLGLVAAAIVALLIASACSSQDVDTAGDDAVSESPLDAAYAAVLDYARGCDIAQSEGSEWLALSLARAGDDPSVPPLSDFASDMERRVVESDGVLDEYASTEYSKAIIALTAVGADARDVVGYNLLGGLSDLDFVKMQGINGPIWALIALDCDASYEFPEAADGAQQDSREALIETVLAAQGNDGGWPYSGIADDPGTIDLTAMAMTAIAPYAGEDGREDAQSAVERAIAYLSDVQAADGGYDSGDGETAESASQVVIALCSLGIDPGADERFAKDGGTVLDNLLTFQMPDGSFSHMQGDPADELATNQACEALVALHRLRAGETALYDISE